MARSALSSTSGHQERATIMSISNDPVSIEFDKLVELLRGLGLDPVDPTDIQRVTIDSHGVEVVRFRRDQAGQLYIGFGERPVSETVTIRINH